MHWTTLGAALAVLSLCATQTAARGSMPVELTTDRFVVRFSADGRPASVLLLPERRELLNVRDPGAGFVVHGKSGGFAPLCDLVLQPGGSLVARTANGTQTVVFAIHRAATHLAFKIEHLMGFPTTSDLALGFQMNADPGARVLGHDYMTQAENRPDGVRVTWPGLWQRALGDPPGGFSLYCKRGDDDEDDIVLHIWAEEGLAHPAVKGPWTYERARAWLADWQRTFPNRSLFDGFDNIGLEDTSLPKLREGARYAQQAGVSGVYLMPWIWRGEYWPIKQTTAGINTAVFPRGEADVRAYSDYLAGMGLMLELHYVSGGIGFEDPRYVKPRLDNRVAHWGKGKLAEPAGKDDTVLRFVPDRGVEAPFVIPSGSSLADEARPPALSPVHSGDIVHVDGELIHVGAFEDTDKPIWTLRGCARGYVGSPARAHPAGAPVTGLIVAYGQNLLPGNWSTLLEEIADAYTGFLNRCRISNAVFDGFEIHDYSGYGQAEKFASMVYQRLERPTASLTSHGLAPACFLEYRFNSTRRKLGGAWGYCADLRLARPSWEASAELEAHFACSQPVSEGIRALGVRDHHGGVTLEVLKTHGKTGAILEAVRGWKDVEHLLSPAQKAALHRTEYPVSPLADSGHHTQSGVVWRLSRVADRYRITPTRVMKRREGDVAWRLGQEHGIIAPRQYVKPGDALLLENPYAPQEPAFVIRVLYAHDYGSSENVVLQPVPAELGNLRDTTVRADGAGLLLTHSNPRAQDLLNENDLPSWQPKGPVDMSSRRAIGMWVTGDGSRSILTIQIPQRDYVVPIDFTGRRYIEIPNGEVAWVDGHWGWRMGTWKMADYGRVPLFHLGFGKVPAQSSASVTVDGLKALKEIPTRLENPVIQVGGGQLAVQGSAASGQYLEYSGGPTASVYDANWNKVADVPVTKRAYSMPAGFARVKVTTTQTAPLPWLETQFTVTGESIVVPSVPVAR